MQVSEHVYLDQKKQWISFRGSNMCLMSSVVWEVKIVTACLRSYKQDFSVLLPYAFKNSSSGLTAFRFRSVICWFSFWINRWGIMRK